MGIEFNSTVLSMEIEQPKKKLRKWVGVILEIEFEDFSWKFPLSRTDTILLVESPKIVKLQLKQCSCFVSFGYAIDTNLYFIIFYL